jgi:hypothetical protein
MSPLLKTAGLWGSLIALVLLLIAFIKQLMAFVSFMMFILKAGIVLAFIGLFALIAFMILRDYQRRKKRDS